MQRITLILAVAFITIGLGVNAQQSMSLDDCISYGLSNHPQIKLAQLQIVAADWQIKENTATGLPQVSAGLGYTGFIQRGGLPSGALSFGGGGGGAIPPVVYEQFTEDQVNALGAFLGSAFASDPDSKIFFSPVHSIAADVSANQLIFSNSYLIAKRAARYYRDYVNDQMTVVRSTLRNQITEAYMPALLISENLKTLDKNISNLEKLLNETKEINKAGFAEQLDVDRLDLSLLTIRSERGNLVRQQEIVINALKLAMGMPVGEAIILSDNTDKLMTQFSDADLISPLNFMDRPEYTNLLKGRELNLLQVKLYEKNWMPNVAAFLQWQGSYQGGFGEKSSATYKDWYFIPSTVGGLKVTSTLFDSGLSKAKRQRALIAVQTIDEQKRLMENGFNMELETARKLYLNAQERLASQQKNLDLAQRIYNTTQTKYKAGIGSSFEMVQAEQSLYTSQQGLMTARFDLLTARVSVKKALGKL